MRTGKIDGRKLYFMLPTALDYLWIWAKIESEKGKHTMLHAGHGATTQKITRIYNRILSFYSFLLAVIVVDDIVYSFLGNGKIISSG